MENLDEQNGTNGGDSSNDDQLIGILSYLGILWIIAYILYDKKKSEINLFHLRQGLGLFIILIAIYITGYLPVIGRLSWILYLGWLAFTVIGIIAAANGEKKELPFIGKFINENLKNFK